MRKKYAFALAGAILTSGMLLTPRTVRGEENVFSLRSKSESGDKMVFETQNGEAQITYQKNVDYLGNFSPTKVCELETVEGKIQIASCEDALPEENGEVHILAGGFEDLTDDGYFFHFSCKKDCQDREADFRQFLLNFEK